MVTTTIPLLPCVDQDRTVEFYGALGFVAQYRQSQPYPYLALGLGAEVQLNFKEPSPRIDPADELSGGCLVMVDDVSEFHRDFVSGLRRRYGRVLAAGLPRLTRLRPGQTRFSLYDPSGNCIAFINHDEPDIEYGGSSALAGLAKAHDNARIYRDFKNDDALAARALDVALRRHRHGATRVEVARAVADRAELAFVLDEQALAEALRAELSAMGLSDEQRGQIADELAALDQIETWFV